MAILSKISLISQFKRFPKTPSQKHKTMEGETNHLIELGLGSNTGPPSISSLGFFKYIYTCYGKRSRNLFVKWNDCNRRLARAIRQRRFLLRCRKEDVNIPKHIDDTCKRQFNVNFCSRMIRNKNYKFLKHHERNLLNWEIRDIFDKIAPGIHAVGTSDCL